MATHEPVRLATVRTGSTCTRLARRVMALLALPLAAALAAPVGAADLDGTLRVARIAMTGDSRTVANTDSSIELDSQTSLELGLRIGVTPLWNVELGLTGARHGLVITGSDQGDVDGGKVWVAPVTALAQYHLPLASKWGPYFGAGLAWGAAFGSDLSSQAEAMGLRDMDLSSKLGFALQAGTDYEHNDRWFASVEVKYLAVSTEVTLYNALGVHDRLDLDMDPWILGLGVGYRF